MPKTLSVMDMSGNKVSDIELADSVFGIEPNVEAMHMAVKAYLAHQRQGTQSALTRAEVRGGGAKPWRQKGTGRARHGSIRSPQWTHGGVAFAPKPRQYRIGMNKKYKKLAMKSALSAKALENEITVLDSVSMDGFKTKNVVAMLNALGLSGKTLIVTSEPSEKLIYSARNIPGVKTTIVGNLNVYDILKYDNFLVLRDAVAMIEEVHA